MTRARLIRAAAATVLVAVLVSRLFVALGRTGAAAKTTVVAFFQNSNGLFAGDDVRILGVPVGRVATIEPQPQRVKVTFWIDRKYSVPADAKAVILSPQLVTGRAIQLTPPTPADP